MNLTVNNLYKSRLLICFLMLVLVKPQYFTQIVWLDHLYDCISLVVAILLIVASVFSNPIPKSRIWIVVFYGSIFFTTLCGSGNIYEYMRLNFASLAMCLMFDIWLEKSPQTLIHASCILEIIVYANLITVLLFPEGMYQTDLYSANWLLGYKNLQIRTILPIVCMALIRSYWKYEKISLSTWLLIICSFVTIVITNSATAFVGYTSFLGMLALGHSKEKPLPRIFTLVNALLASVLTFAFIIFYNMQELISYLIENILKRNLSLTGRLPVWKRSILLFLRKPILGYGYLTNDEYTILYGNVRWAVHPHNYLLFIIMTGGLLLGIVAIFGYWKVSREIRKNIETIYGKIILFTLCSFLIMGITESLTSTVLLYPMLILGMNVEKIITAQKEKAENKIEFTGLPKILIRWRRHEW